MAGSEYERFSKWRAGADVGVFLIAGAGQPETDGHHMILGGTCAVVRAAELIVWSPTGAGPAATRDQYAAWRRRARARELRRRGQGAERGLDMSLPKLLVSR